MEKLTLSSHYTYKNILRQCLSPMIMMLITSIYVVVDGLFISNINGSEAFAGVNIIFPIIMIVGGLGFMFGSGGSALVSKLLGEKRTKKANQVFTMMIYSAFLLTFVFSFTIYFFIDDIAKAIASIDPNSTEEMVNSAIKYGTILIWGQPIFAVQSLFQNFFVVDEKPHLGLIEMILSGVTNIVMDAILIVGCGLGVEGAAIGTICGYVVGVAFSIFYFGYAKNNIIAYAFCKPDFKSIGKCMLNGSSDFIFNISASIVGIIFNAQLLAYLHEDGVNAYGVLMYISFVFSAIYIGFAIGIAPIIGYNYGAKNHKELKSIVKKMLILLGITSLIMVSLSESLAYPLACLFTKKESLIELSTKAIRIYSISYIFCGFSIFITAMFTGLNNGLVSGLLSLLRSLVFQILFVYVLPLAIGADGIWWSIVISEALSLAVCFFFFVLERKRYHYA